MSSVATTPTNLSIASYEGMTYQQVKEQTMVYLGECRGRFTHLNTSTEVSIKERQDRANKLVADKNPAKLAYFFQKAYQNYATILEEKNIAQTALDQIRSSIDYCTPVNVSLRPEQVRHMVKQGYDMSEYGVKELSLADCSTELREEFQKLSQLIIKTESYIKDYPIALNGAARFLRQTTRSKTWGDLLPENMVGPTAYFVKGFEQFQKQTPAERVEILARLKEQSTGTQTFTNPDSTLREPTSAELLQTLDGIVAGAQTGKQTTLSALETNGK